MPFNPKEEQGIYNTQNPAHRQLVLKKTQALEKAYTALSATDQWILGGGALAVIGAVPFIPFTWLMVVSGAFMAGTKYNVRGELSTAHQAALDEAVKVYHWCFDGTEVNQVLRYKELQDLTLLLAPLLSSKEWKKWERQNLLEIASDEKIADRMSRQVAHAARGTVSSIWQKGMTTIGLASEEQTAPKPISDSPSSTKENAVFIAKVDGVDKTNMLGNVVYKVYGHNQSLNPLAILSLTSQVKDKIVEEGMKAAVNATTTNKP